MRNKTIIKKIFYGILLILLIINTIILFINLNINKYDVNNDNTVDSKDLFDLKKYLINKESEK